MRNYCNSVSPKPFRRSDEETKPLCKTSSVIYDDKEVFSGQLWDSRKRQLQLFAVSRIGSDQSRLRIMQEISNLEVQRPGASRPDRPPLRSPRLNGKLYPIPMCSLLSSLEEEEEEIKYSKTTGYANTTSTLKNVKS
ncbi:hypothetical protein M514_17208 [Trichuris suis]|uniref:Uncharacterized protein n=1 Tax=Trichuris suis TaxID=68888 RepID=A0A085NMP0_9BILA|nr:hypothetical protein M514_17208 [Trichuris suis]